MKVEITTQPGIFAEGRLRGVISGQDGAAAHIVIEMRVTGGGDPVHITLDEFDLSTIMRLAKGSTVEKIRDAIR